ncbi:YcaO-like family protein [Roseibium sp. SCPC15]|uniref:YcaO-like family protein n=1 Tax=Roseibium sp. SCP15 TaxID=3141376 RepID=UPI003335CF03
MRADEEMCSVEVGTEEVLLPTRMVDDLQRVGLVTAERKNSRAVMKSATADLLLFLPLLSSFDFRLVPQVRDGSPIHFCTGLLKLSSQASDFSRGDQINIPAGGQSETASYAALGCLGELAERISLWTLADTDPRVFLREEALPEVEMQRVLGLSRKQGDAAMRQLELSGALRTDNGPNWESVSNKRIKVRSLENGNEAQFPSIGVLFQELERETGHSLSFASSVGCAVWHDRQGARERALLELVERDAVAQAWYNRLGIKTLPWVTSDNFLSAELDEFLTSQKREWALFSVASDFDVHVVMAVSFEQGGRMAAFGSAAAWDIESACQSAIQEMLQSENALYLMNRAYAEGSDRSTSPSKLPRHLAYARNRSILEDLPLKSAPTAEEGSFGDRFDYEKLLRSCLKQNIEIWEFDVTRPDLEIPCIKLLSPDLCSWEPRFGKRRLYDGVVERGHRECRATEAEFSARPFPF